MRECGIGRRSGASQGDVMKHAPGFLKLVEEVRTLIHEVSVAEARERLAARPGIVVVDVREEDAFAALAAATPRLVSELSVA